MKPCFLMYRWEKVQPESDSTLRLSHEAAERGLTVALTTPSGLRARDGVAHAFCYLLERTPQVAPRSPAFHAKATTSSSSTG